MDRELDIATAVAILLFLSVLVFSAYLWFIDLNTKDKKPETPEIVRAWSIGWVNFGLFICALIISVSLTQLFAAKAISLFSETIVDQLGIETTASTEETFTPDHQPESTIEAEPTVPNPWIAMLSVLLLQVPMIATFYGLRSIYPEIFGGALNQKSVAIRKAISGTTPYFIRCFLAIWLTGIVWMGLLSGLQKLGILNELPPQQLITILINGENPVAASLLVALAVLLAPFVEEIIFRGAIYRFLKGYFPIFGAQWISGIFFALMHFNLMSFLPLVVIGVFLARIYEREGNILHPMIFHAYWNGFSLLMLFLTSQS